MNPQNFVDFKTKYCLKKYTSFVLYFSLDFEEVYPFKRHKKTEDSFRILIGFPIPFQRRKKPAKVLNI